MPFLFLKDHLIDRRPGRHHGHHIGLPIDHKIEEDRILDTYEWKDFHLWKDDVFALKNFGPGEIKEFFDYAHDKLRNENGPQALQVMECALDAYKELKGARGEYHAFQAKRLRITAMGVLAYLRAVKQNHDSPIVRERAVALERRYRDEIGPTPAVSAAAGRFISGRIKRNMQKPPKPVVSDPPPRWSYYNTFDDQVWVKRGRGNKGPVPYEKKGVSVVGKILQRYLI